VDTERPDGSRSLLVPNVKNADQLDFAGFFAAYEELIRKVRTNKLAPEDFAGTTASITNPGMIGTVHSVPRLMPGQGFINRRRDDRVPGRIRGRRPPHRRAPGRQQGVHAHEHLRPPHHPGRRERRVPPLDAPPPARQRTAFYDEIFQSFGVPYEPARWSTDVSPLDDENTPRSRRSSACTSSSTCTGCAATLIANLDPLGRRPPHTHPEPRRAALRAHHLGISTVSSRRGGLGSGALDRKTMPLRDILGILRDAYSRTIGVEYMHIQEPEQKEWIQARVEAPPTPLDGPAAAPHPRAPERGGGVRGLHPHEVPGPEAVQPGRCREPDPDARRAAQRRGGRGHGRGRARQPRTAAG